MNQRERMFKVARGKMVDRLPYAPRIDLWFNANRIAGTLPKGYEDNTMDEICRKEGWALHKLIPDLLDIHTPEDIVDRAIGIFRFKEFPFRAELPDDVERKVRIEGEKTIVEYYTPIGKVQTKTIYTEQMRVSGTTMPWIDEHILKTPKDYRVVGYIFSNMRVIPTYERFEKWMREYMEDGFVTACASFAASPTHHIMKEFLDATKFYYHYNDNYKEMMELSEALEPYYDKLLEVVVNSPAEIVFWGANYDDMITYPAFFEKHILPWLQKASDVLRSKGKILDSHCDGENFGLLDLIRDSGIHVAEAICPFPMTKVPIGEYYKRWHEKISIFGGIHSNLLLEEATSEEEFHNYMDEFFKVIAPGDHFIVGIADTTPPNAKFDRLREIGDIVYEKGRLPLEGGAVRPITKERPEETAEYLAKKVIEIGEEYPSIRNSLLEGDHIGILSKIEEALDGGAKAKDILNKGLISSMEVVSERFTSSEIFIPEVLLSARAMNAAVNFLEPYLGKEVDKETIKTKIIIGTVKGDFHNIGKNIVSTIFMGVGFEVHDIGVNVDVETFVSQVRKKKPQVLGLSALLTTTIPEMKKVIEAISQAGLHQQTKVIVGGAPVTRRFAQEIGADGYAPDAGSAVDEVKKIIKINVLPS